VNSEIKVKRLTPQTKRRIFNLLFRRVPLIPAMEIYDLLEEARLSRGSLDGKINEAYESLKSTSELIHELELDLQERTNKVSLLRAEYEKYSRLAEIEEEKAMPIINQIELSLGKGKNRDVIINIIISFVVGGIIFILGIWLGPKLTNLFGIKS
jgi:hypothetical protein